MKGISERFERIGTVVQARPGVTLLFALMLVGVSIGGATGLTTVSGDRAFVGESATLAEYEESFDRGPIVALVQGDPRDPETLRAVDRFDRRLSGAENVDAVVTPADRVRRQYGYVPDSRRDIDRALDAEEPVIVRIVLAPDLTQAQKTAVYRDALEAKDWAGFPAGVEVVVTGDPAFNAQLTRNIQSSTRTLTGLAGGLMIVALFLLFRGVRLELLPIVTVFVGIVYTFGVMGYVGIPNSILTSAVFPIIIGLGIDYSVQFHQRYEEELSGAPPREALPRALGGVGPPVLVAMLAAALGFIATWINATDVPSFVWFAQASIVGIAMTFIAALVLLVPVLTMYARRRGDGQDAASRAGEGAAETGGGPDSRRDDPASDPREATGVGTLGRTLGRASRVAATNPGVVIAVAGVLFASGLYAGTTLDTVAEREEFVPDDLPALLDLQQFRDRTGGGTSVRYPVLVSGGDVTDPETLRWMDEYQRVARDQPLVTDVVTPADAIRRYNGGRLPATEAGVRRALERMPETQRERFYNEGNFRVVVVTQPGLSPEQEISFADNTEEAIETSGPPPGAEAELTGVGVITPRLIHRRIVNRNRITLVGLGLVFGLLGLYYRHPVKSTVPLVPILFIIGWQGLYMAALDIEVSPLGASLGALTVGIGAEYTIIVMERYYEEKRNGAAPERAIEIAAQRVGKAITVSGTTTVFGFSALVLSPFPIVSDFGFLTVGVILLTLVGALVIMPPALVVLDELAGDWHQWREATAG